MDLSRFPRRRYTPFSTPIELLPHFTKVLAASCPGDSSRRPRFFSSRFTSTITLFPATAKSPASKSSGSAISENRPGIAAAMAPGVFQSLMRCAQLPAGAAGMSSAAPAGPCSVTSARSLDQTEMGPAAVTTRVRRSSSSPPGRPRKNCRRRTTVPVPALANSADLSLQRGTEALASGRYAQAARYLEQTLAQGRMTYDAHLALGRAYRHLGRPRDAAFVRPELRAHEHRRYHFVEQSRLRPWPSPGQVFGWLSEHRRRLRENSADLDAQFPRVYPTL